MTEKSEDIDKQNDILKTTGLKKKKIGNLWLKTSALLNKLRRKVILT